MLTKYEVEEEEKVKKVKIKPITTGLTIDDVNRLYDMYSANIFDPPTVAYARGLDGALVARQNPTIGVTSINVDNFYEWSPF